MLSSQKINPARYVNVLKRLPFLSMINPEKARANHDKNTHYFASIMMLFGHHKGISWCITEVPPFLPPPNEQSFSVSITLLIRSRPGMNSVIISCPLYFLKAHLLRSSLLLPFYFRRYNLEAISVSCRFMGMGA